MLDDEKTIAVGDRLRLNVKMIETLQRKWDGLSLVVEVTDITEDNQGVKLLSVKEPVKTSSSASQPNTSSSAN